MINVLVNGYKGKMGTETVNAVNADPNLTLVGTTDRDDDLATAIQKVKPDVVVDFTHPSCIIKNSKTILAAGAHAVIGTTGLSDKDLKALDSAAQKSGKAILVAPNFAIGAVLMMKVSAEIAKHMPKVEIIELHHDKKADAPSGTAIKTAEVIAESNPEINSEALDEKELIKGARGGAKHRIPMHSVRLPGFLASQEVIFGGLGQTLTIRHDTINRKSFMPGVVLAITKIPAYTGLVYGLENLL